MLQTRQRKRRVSGVYEIRADGPTWQRLRAQTPADTGSNPVQRTALHEGTHGSRALGEPLAKVLVLFAKSDDPSPEVVP